MWWVRSFSVRDYRGGIVGLIAISTDFHCEWIIEIECGRHQWNKRVRMLDVPSVF